MIIFDYIFIITVRITLFLISFALLLCVYDFISDVRKTVKEKRELEKLELDERLNKI